MTKNMNTDETMIVFHGTDSRSAKNIITNGINLKLGEKSVDNGQGFYMTPNLMFAKERAKMSANKYKAFFNDSDYDDIKPAVIKIEIMIPLNDVNINVKEFDGCTYEWKEFIFYNRMGKRFIRKWNIDTVNHNLDNKYDIVIDETADSGVTDIVSGFRYKTDISSLKKAINKIGKPDIPYWDRQISLHSKKACECIVSMEIIHVNE